MAVVNFAKIHRTKIVILENVLKFAWAEVENVWHEAGYATQVALLDSKDFYLPQTRQRGYMIGISRAAVSEWNADFDADAAVKQWFEILSKLQRRASSPFTDFIFADDDVQLQEHKREAAVVLAAGQTNDWKKCRLEVLSYRACKFLGFKRPFTDWENNGSCHVPDFCFKLWFKRQVERVWDTADINHLRSVAERFYDFAYKL
jgi:site-specific DNA-cytosine methylase